MVVNTIAGFFMHFCIYFLFQNPITGGKILHLHTLKL